MGVILDTSVLVAVDLQIAATALRHAFSLATLNQAEFRRVPGLALVDVQPFV